MKARLKLESFPKIQKKINNAVLDRIVKNLNVDNIKNATIDYAKKAIESSDAWLSLQGQSYGKSDLAADFGIPQGTEKERLNTIIGVWLDNIQVKRRVLNRHRSFVYQIQILGIRSDFADVVSLGAAITENRNRQTKELEYLPWLEWLVLRGDDTIIEDHEVIVGSYNRNRSRSGRAIMKMGGTFSVEPSFAGTEEKNFITEALNSNIDRDRINRIVFNEVRNALRK